MLKLFTLILVFFTLLTLGQVYDYSGEWFFSPSNSTSGYFLTICHSQENSGRLYVALFEGTSENETWSINRIYLGFGEGQSQNGKKAVGYIIRVDELDERFNDIVNYRLVLGSVDIGNDGEGVGDKVEVTLRRQPDFGDKSTGVKYWATRISADRPLAQHCAEPWGERGRKLPGTSWSTALSDSVVVENGGESTDEDTVYSFAVLDDRRGCWLFQEGSNESLWDWGALSNGREAGGRAIFYGTYNSAGVPDAYGVEVFVRYSENFALDAYCELYPTAFCETVYGYVQDETTRNCPFCDMPIDEYDVLNTDTCQLVESQSE